MRKGITSRVVNLPPPPRRIRPTYPKPILRFIGRLLVLSVFLVTLFFTVALVAELALRFLGHEVSAAVSSIHERAGKKNYVRTARYTYAVPGGALRSDESRISYDAFRTLREPFLDAGKVADDMIFPESQPGQLAVRVYSLGPLVYSRPVEHEWGGVLLLIPALFAPATGFLFFALYLAIIIRPRRYRRIFSHGIAVPGRIFDRYEDPSTDGCYYAVKFAYIPEGEAEPRVGEQPLPGPKEFKAAEIDQEVTVLYDPDNPKKSALYEYGGFTVEE